MENHQGQVVEYYVRKYGYSITDLAEFTKVNRRSIYNWFQTKDLKPDIILRIGLAIRHDFSTNFPDLFSPDDFKSIYAPKQRPNVSLSTTHVAEEQFYKDKCMSLLEKISTMRHHVELAN